MYYTRALAPKMQGGPLRTAKEVGAAKQLGWELDAAPKGPYRHVIGGIRMSTPHSAALEAAQREYAVVTPDVIDQLRAIVGADHVLSAREELLVYECDGYTLERVPPSAVVLPASTEEVSQVLALLYERGIPFIPRGAGTSLSGSTIAVQGGIVVGLSRMKKIVEIDLANRLAVVEAGVVNLWVTHAVEAEGYHYAPDPSSQGACTIGGNVATNSGGPHTLKYGVTLNHILGVEMVLADGRVVNLGGNVEDALGYDLTGFVVGSEGTLGLVTKATVRLTRSPQAFRTLLAVFKSVDEATRTVSEIIRQGIIPAAVEMMDNLIIQAVEAAYHVGFPTDAAAVLIVELDGLEAGIDTLTERVRGICTAHGATEIRQAVDEAERKALWSSRKRAFGAVGRLSSSYVTQDGVVPRTKLPEILQIVTAVGQKYRLRVANVFHAGDGNIHPILLFDQDNADEVERVIQASDEILTACIDLGGSVTGEHGIGIEKVEHLAKMYSPEDLKVMTDLRAAFDPESRCNPGKLFPSSKGCIEIKRPRPASPA